ncbi:MAG TPA: gluconate 2-dehydrogenase subunit 3 family protein [Bacillus bacterium]|nr:gluconate 2-dehydrogenase subunit 3 family protein [Bacillus sp. (in: firmicutes)]
MEGKKEVQKKYSRRSFLKNSGFTIGGLAIGAGITSQFTKTKEVTKEVPVEKIVENNANRALMYFSPQQYRIVDAAAERVFPEDENGPGAKKLNVAYFIDHQLASAWGTRGKEYTMGPFIKGEATQGYQGHLNRQQIFDIGLKGLHDHSMKTYQKPFEELAPEQQDEILIAFEADQVELKGVTASYFFSQLRSVTIEGVYADPMYGGNYQMEGWKMKNYPGHQMSYTKIIEDATFHVIKPASLNSQHQGHQH